MNGAGAFDHTKKTDLRIRKAYESKERLRDVAVELRTTRNTIIGRARVLGLCEAGRDREASRLNEGNADVLLRWIASNPEGHSRNVEAMHAGRDRYWASRKAQKSREDA